MTLDVSSHKPWALDLDGFTDPVPLVRKGLGAPARPGVYVISCGDCVPHIGTSSKLQVRIRELASLKNHRGSAEVLCAAFCTGEPPSVRWREMASDKTRAFESALKGLGEPPQPRERFKGCKDGMALRRSLVQAAGENTSEAGYVEALFDVGEQLHRLFTTRFDAIWSIAGEPPGPWRTARPANM